MIGLLLGFPAEMWPKLQHWSETTIALGGGPRYHEEEGIISAMEFAGACAELYETKKSEIADGCPMDDVMTKWVTVESETGGEVGGEAFGLDQIISDCLLLLDGGAETTRTVIARTLLELADRPDQWQLLKDGADIEVATEEFIRWVTPVHNFCRAATEMSNSTAAPSARANRCCWPTAPRIGIRPISTTPRPSTSPARRTITSRSVSVPTSASAPRWPVWRSAPSSIDSGSGSIISSGSPTSPTSRCRTHSCSA